ncbi:putative leucine-rich repeat receptor-like serine/threonine-protein kinase At2g14440 [Cryptomeria japonica]|nr:putative leucine-rich repeat receptor-like serine/threonine-protein kinase At2g14440 [Cryptomeria japonica]XP_059071856.1 putative leucine-rich repeat receptor-like serine/threonine-protein kinase At2g14440 [Cryptomeria japonica]
MLKGSSQMGTGPDISPKNVVEDSPPTSSEMVRLNPINGSELSNVVGYALVVGFDRSEGVVHVSREVVGVVHVPVIFSRGVSDPGSSMPAGASLLAGYPLVGGSEVSNVVGSALVAGFDRFEGVVHVSREVVGVVYVPIVVSRGVSGPSPALPVGASLLVGYPSTADFPVLNSLEWKDEVAKVEDGWITVKVTFESVLSTLSNAMSSSWYRFPDDQYDRLWEPLQVTFRTHMSTNDSFFGSIRNQPPVSVLKTAITSFLGEDQLLVSSWHILPQGIYYFAVYLCNINKTSLSGNNTFQIFIGNVQIAEIVVPEYMYCLSPESRLEFSTTESIDIRIRSQVGSHMRPFINAAEAYQIVKITNMTHAGDVLAIRKIADTVNVPDDWTTGDPCLPSGLPLTSVICNEEDPPRVIIVNLTNKGLTGNIPPSIANLTALKQLLLGNNNFSGFIPDLSTLMNLTSLQLQNNQLTGDIPSSLEKLPMLNELFLQNNKLDGDVPPGLVKPGLKLQVLPQRFINGDKDDPNEFQKVVVEYSEEDIKAATNNYSTIIGKGGFGTVFYGQLSGNDVAVTLLSRVHHKNLVNLLGYCRQPIVALVHKFMEYGTLTNHIHGSAKRERPLDWQTRINIALQAAEGLLYLHEGCSPPIIHRDVKCTNILLDKNMSAKITDFGLSKLLQNSRSHVTTEVKGTLGYLDPEYYGMSSLNEKSDVYSFGVVLLEIISGVPPKEGIVESAKRLLSCGGIAYMMDSLLGGRYSLESAWRVAEVAYNCVEPRPVNRPTMNTVVKELAEAKALVSHDGIKPTSLKVLDDVPEAR